jgi:hypothetical protein
VTLHHTLVLTLRMSTRATVEPWIPLPMEVPVAQPPRTDIVRLNVGGKLFVTSRATLQQSPFFEGLLRYEPELDGAYFIDRSPKIFAVVLQLLRTGVLFWSSESELRAILIETDFFLIKSRFQHALCPIRNGLYTVGKENATSTVDSHPWILFVETSFNADKFRPCQVLLTGVVDEEVRRFVLFVCSHFVKNRFCFDIPQSLGWEGL